MFSLNDPVDWYTINQPKSAVVAEVVSGFGSGRCGNHGKIVISYYDFSISIFDFSPSDIINSFDM